MNTLTNHIEDIAIVGLECKFPGANSVKEYWDLLYQQESGVEEVIGVRWAEDFYKSGTPEHSKMNTKWGGLLKWYDKFDPAFFGLSKHEAERIDPQQRLLLMITYEALEDGGLTLESIKGTKTGVFVGVGNSDFSTIATQNRSSINAYTGAGTALCMLANRLSYLFDLKGPSMAIDTACSSSLTALNQACESLWRGSSNMAIVGGTSLNIWPDTSIVLSQAGMMSVDGQCKTFDDSANGFVKGEGAGIVLLKRMSDALKDNNKIWGVIKSVGINHNGKSNGLTAPSRFQQRALIQQALKDSNINPEEISFIETHGTGTSLGDPIEFNALSDVFMQDRADDNPCFLGAVKTNIGHLEASAGIAGIIKVLLAMKHQTIPANLNLNKVNKYIALNKTNFQLPTENIKWLPKNGRRLAGVSSFGFGGTNGHAILEEYLAPTAVQFDTLATQHMLNLSAKSEASLQQLIQNHITFLEAEDTIEISLAEICAAAQTKRSHHRYRLAIVGASKVEMIQKLNAYQNQSFQATKPKKKIAFLFTGQGSQYLRMVKTLYGTNTIFSEYFDQCMTILQPLIAQKDILSLINGSDKLSDLIHETEYTQPILFAVEYALTKTLQKLGVQPTVLIGHSLGELVAACIAGVFSLKDGLKLAATRGKLMQTTSSDGRMLSIFTDQLTLNTFLEHFDQLSLAAHNGYNSHVVSGHKDQIHLLSKLLDQQNIRYKLLQVKRAFHSQMMEPILEKFQEELNTIQLHQPKIPIISNIGADFIGTMFTEPDYWVQHLRKTTDFLSGMEQLAATNCDILLEIGPNPVLINLFQRSMDEMIDKTAFIPTLMRGKDSENQFQTALAELYNCGLNLNWETLIENTVNPWLELPKYPFDLQPCWLPEYTEVCQLKPAVQIATPSVDIPTPIPAKIHIKSTPPSNLKSIILEQLNNVLVLPITDYEQVVDKRLVDLGLESIMVFNLRHQLKNNIPGLQKIPMNVFSDATLSEFIEYIADTTQTTLKNTHQLKNQSTQQCLDLMTKWTYEFDVEKPLRIDQKLVHKHELENVLLARIEQVVEDTFLLEMTQDIKHSFFYEHYLDHVPAMYILESILQAARALPHLYYDIPYGVFFVINEMESRFDEFAELNAPVFFKIDVEDKVYKNGQLFYATLNGKIYQRNKPIGFVKGTGQFFQKEHYQGLRKEKMNQPLLAQA